MEHAEAIDVDEKSRFGGQKNEWLELVKTIVAMANTSGGRVVLRSVDCPPQALEQTRVDDQVNRYVEPAFHEITSIVDEAGRCTITVERSRMRPHVFVTDQSYQDARGTVRDAFRAGQIFARHDGRTEPATGDDLQQMMADTIGRMLQGLGGAIERLATHLSDPAALPVTLANDDAIAFSIRKPEEVYPYLTSELAEKLGKTINWTAQALKRLGLRNDPRFRWEVPTGRTTRSPRYTEDAYRLLHERLEAHPDWDPYHDDGDAARA